MKVLQPYGFFSDLPFGDASAPKLRNSLHDKVAGENAERIAHYLRAGVQYSMVPMVVHDVIDDEEPAIGPLRYLTDGEWVWRSDLPYYVEKYHCRVADDFIAHMKSRGWRYPTDIDLNDLQLPPEQNGQTLDRLKEWPQR